jgi:hypothetical protein
MITTKVVQVTAMMGTVCDRHVSTMPSAWTSEKKREKKEARFTSPPDEPSPERERSGNVVDVGVVAEDKLADNREAVRGVEGDGAEGEDGINDDGRGEVKESEADYRGAGGEEVSMGERGLRKGQECGRMGKGRKRKKKTYHRSHKRAKPR